VVKHKPFMMLVTDNKDS